MSHTVLVENIFDTESDISLMGALPLTQLQCNVNIWFIFVYGKLGSHFHRNYMQLTVLSQVMMRES